VQCSTAYGKYLILVLTSRLHSQTLTGLAEGQTADVSFLVALSHTLVTLLGEGTTVSDVTLSSFGRRLLANQNLKYTITATNGMTAEDIIDTLQDAMDSGDFLALFNANAGLSMDDVSNLQTVDLTTTDAPTPSPKKGANLRGVQHHRNKNFSQALVTCLSFFPSQLVRVRHHYLYGCSSRRLHWRRLACCCYQLLPLQSEGRKGESTRHPHA
jgi:hypothetical protein